MTRETEGTQRNEGNTNQIGASGCQKQPSKLDFEWNTRVGKTTSRQFVPRVGRPFAGSETDAQAAVCLRSGLRSAGIRRTNS